MGVFPSKVLWELKLGSALGKEGSKEAGLPSTQTPHWSIRDHAIGSRKGLRRDTVRIGAVRQ